MDCEGAVSARKLANTFAEPGTDANLDCEKGIMRALMEHNHATTNLVSLVNLIFFQFFFLHRTLTSPLNFFGSGLSSQFNDETAASLAVL